LATLAFFAVYFIVLDAFNTTAHGQDGMQTAKDAKNAKTPQGTVIV
jgi:hypothetical protein